MGHPSSSRYVVDQDDPRAPIQEIWDSMTPEERAETLANLPSEFPVSEAAPPEGDPHFDAVVDARQVLRGHFGRIGARVYIANNLPVYYPGKPMFSPDVIAVRDVETHSREHWTVSAESKGLDLALEILWSGRRKKDLRDNVEKFAELGILEYFVFDRRKLGIHGYRLSDDARGYERIVPQGGRYASRVLGLDLIVEGNRLRFLYDLAPLPNAVELVTRLDAMLGEMTEKRDAAEQRADEEAQRAKNQARRAKEGARRAKEEARRAEEEAQRAKEEARRAEEEARRRHDAEQKLAEALVELARLKGGS